MNKQIEYICNCGSKDVNVMSVEEGVTTVQGMQVSTVDITYICNECGNTEVEKHYLYKLDKVILRCEQDR